VRKALSSLYLFIADGNVESVRVDLQQQNVVPAAINKIRDLLHLLGGRRVYETDLI
jgi:hypothetical protein